MLDRVIAHKVTELGSFLQHFRREALQRTVIGGFAEALQFHELAHVNEFAEEHDVCALVLAIHDVLYNDNAPRTERHDRQDAQNHDGRDIGLCKHLE